MKSGKAKKSAAVPWGLESEWREANKTIRYLRNRYKSQLQKAAGLARRIARQYECLSPLMDELCMATCPWCPEPCCLHAKIWYDHRDLVFLHLVDIEPPNRQVIAKQNEICRYLGAKGCTLPRISRPFICTWYRCPTQNAALKKMSGRDQKCMIRMIRDIQQLRKRVEEAFIRVN